MPEEPVKVRFEVTGDSEAAAAVQKVGGAFDEHGKKVENAGKSHTHFAHQVRGAAHVVTGTVGKMAGAIDPELGKIVGSLGMGAHMFRYFGAQVAIAVTAVEAISAVIEHYIKKQKEAEDFALKIGKAIKTWDLAAANEQLGKLNDELDRFNYEGEQVLKSTEKMGSTIGGFWASPIASLKVMFTDEKELEERRKTAAETAKRLFKESGEARKIELEVGKEMIKVETEAAKLAESRAQNIGDVVSAMERQQKAAHDLARAEFEIMEIEEQRKIKKLQVEGADDEAAARMKALNAKRTAFGLGEGVREEADAKARRDKVMKFETEMGEASLRQLKAGGDARLSMIKANEEAELAAVENYATTGEELARGTERVKTEAVMQGVDARRSAIEQEASFWKMLAESYPENVEVQKEANAKLTGLAQERLSIEQEANGKIIENRRQMIEKLKAQEAEKASIGEGLEAKAAASLKKQGVTMITSDMVKAEATRLSAWGEYYAKQYDTGGALTVEQLDFAKEFQRSAAGLRKTGLGAGGSGIARAIGLAEQERGAAYGFRVSPEDMVNESVRGGFEGSMKDSFEGVKAQVKKGLDDIKGMLTGDTIGGYNLANTITDMVIRKLEFEAARQA